MIRALDPVADRAAVWAFWDSARDFSELERGLTDHDRQTDGFFDDAPPGADPAKGMRLGLYQEDRLVGISSVDFGFPEPNDGYIGLLAFAEDVRGGGLGSRLLAHIEAEARARGAVRLYVGVLIANTRGRAFWEREGFVVALPPREITIGAKTQLAQRLVKELR
jgi:GNAT superfamily N-acetyltransferase